MTHDNIRRDYELLKQLCKQASRETDPYTLTELVKRIIALYDAQQPLKSSSTGDFTEQLGK